MSYFSDYDQLRNLTIGTVDSVSPTELKVLLDITAPLNTAINTGTPTLFPRINGFVLIPNEVGALVGIISWVGIEHSQFPKRKGLKDFDIIDLPYPQRKMSVNPIGILKQTDAEGYILDRGVYSYPCVGDIVILPTQEQLEAIVENRDKNAKVIIGYAPIAANAPVKVDPDKLFGRHLAVLGNTGSGKSCSVAGLIRWSLEAAREWKGNDSPLNARFIILDPNGEYSKTFEDLRTKVRKFTVKINESDTKDFEQLRVPAWMWNSYEWSSITQASGKTQRPLLRRALREIRNGSDEVTDDITIQLRRHFSSCLVSLKNDLNTGASAYIEKPGRNDFGKKVQTFAKSAEHFCSNPDITDEIRTNLQELHEKLQAIAQDKYNTFPDNGRTVEYFNPFGRKDVEDCIQTIEDFLESLGSVLIYEGPDEDSPVFFKGDDLPNHLERLAQEQNVLQYLDFLIMRIRTMLSDARMGSIIGTENPVSLDEWLNDYIGSNKSSNGEIAVIDLSLVPTDVIHLIIAVISRIVFEALQRYRRKTGKQLPTVMVLEEAHTFVSRYSQSSDDSSPARMCCQTFERIAREGRKFGLGLLLSSQRPAELSPTVLSQCNTFLLHRIVNDKDQELVRSFVPDNLGALLKELPVLPTRKAILLGLAAPIPILVEMKELKEKQRPQSDDPQFWDIWTGKVEREVDWKIIADEWQGKNDE